MKKIFLTFILCTVLTGCSYKTWQCQHYACQSITFSMAVNRCNVVANTSRSGYLVWEQCMKSYGYNLVQCDPNQYNENPCELEWD